MDRNNAHWLFTVPNAFGEAGYSKADFDKFIDEIFFGFEQSKCFWEHEDSGHISGRHGDFFGTFELDYHIRYTPKRGGPLPTEEFSEDWNLILTITSITLSGTTFRTNQTFVR